MWSQDSVHQPGFQSDCFGQMTVVFEAIFCRRTPRKLFKYTSEGFIIQIAYLHHQFIYIKVCPLNNPLDQKRFENQIESIDSLVV